MSGQIQIQDYSVLSIDKADSRLPYQVVAFKEYRPLVCNTAYVCSVFVETLILLPYYSNFTNFSMGTMFQYINIGTRCNISDTTICQPPYLFIHI